MWQPTGSLGIASVSVKHAMYDEERSDRGPPCLLITVPEACVPASHPIIVSSTDIFSVLYHYDSQNLPSFSFLGVKAGDPWDDSCRSLDNCKAVAISYAPQSHKWRRRLAV